jgi:hypothetical protein
LQIQLQQISPTNEASDYDLWLQPNNNVQGLRVTAGGREIAPNLVFTGLNPGAYDMTFEVYRASDRYEYDPITFYWQSLCDTNAAALFISRNWTLTVSYVRPCAQAEFHRLEFDSFQVDSTKFDFHAINSYFIQF